MRPVLGIVLSSWAAALATADPRIGVHAISSSTAPKVSHRYYAACHAPHANGTVTLAGSASKISPGASVVTPRSHCVFIFFHHHSVSNGCGNFEAAVAQELRGVSYLMGSKDGAYVVCSVWGTLDPLGASGDFRLDTTNSCIAFP